MNTITSARLGTASDDKLNDIKRRLSADYELRSDNTFSTTVFEKLAMIYHRTPSTAINRSDMIRSFFLSRWSLGGGTDEQINSLACFFNFSFNK